MGRTSRIDNELMRVLIGSTCPASGLGEVDTFKEVHSLTACGGACAHAGSCKSELRGP